VSESANVKQNAEQYQSKRGKEKGTESERAEDGKEEERIATSTLTISGFGGSKHARHCRDD
jgi:hypothetical protein